ncbi:MAG TPA: helix-turn-helix domain-containing protein [Bryobacteraceae bacterium]|nr:helix-turn-helix domain-containing protein [Bryobacteraceae bacterium]
MATRDRSNQRLRTRKELLQAAQRLLKDGRTPTLAEVAEAALVSRATAYRYFPNTEALLAEAPLDADIPGAGQIFAADRSVDPAERVDRAEAALHEMSYRNERQLRVWLGNLLTRSADHSAEPRRQNRRTELITAALAPSREAFDRTTYKRLCAALALFFGTESMIVFRDVLEIEPAEARKVKSWAIHALVEAALRESKANGKSRR